MKDQILLEAAAFIKRAAPTQAFYEHLIEEREKSRTRLETARGELLLVEQGQAQALTKLLQLIEGAENTLEKQ
jgi:hypothetical protein